MAVTEPTRETVDSWLAAVRADLTRIAGELQPLLDEQARLRAREALLVRLSDSFTSPNPVMAEETAGAIPADGSVKDYVRACAVEILKASDQPMHINQLHAEFLARGFRVPGAGRPANLTAHLGRAEGIMSPGRGLYALAPASSQPAVAAVRKRRRRRRAKRA